MHSEILRIESMGEEVIADQKQGEQGLIVIVGGCNTINSRGVIQINGETLSAIASGIHNLPPESIKEVLVQQFQIQNVTKDTKAKSVY